VPAAAPNYWLKRIVPPVEFGAMHAILFQLALLPLTMCRATLASLSTTKLSLVLPFAHVTDFHIFLGYVFCTVMILAVILFFAFFGKVCADHRAGKDPLDACAKLTEEIMITGYAILACTLIVLASSYFRNKLKFETFYFLHHFGLIMFVLAILHTLDREFRNQTATGQARSQVFKWISTSLFIYLADRLWQNLQTHRRVPIKSIARAKDGMVLVLFLKKPGGFHFAAGQYAFIQVPEIDPTFHPFSISAAPSSNELSFIIEVNGPGSWTSRFADLVYEKDLHKIMVNVMGGFGVPVGGTVPSDRIVAVGTGTGIVPMISLILEHVFRLKLLKKDTLLAAKQQRLRSTTDGLSNFCVSLLQLRYRKWSLHAGGRKSPYFRYIANHAKWARVHKTFEVLASFWLVFEIWLFASSLSFDGLPAAAPATSNHGRVLRAGTLIAVVVYALVYIYKLCCPSRHPRDKLCTVDGVLLVLQAALVGVHWDDMRSWVSPRPEQLVLRSLLSLWRVAILWRLGPSRPVVDHSNLGRNLMGVQAFHLIWSCRSANLVAGYMPVFEDIAQQLVRELDITPDGLRKFVDISIHCTDLQPEQIGRLLADFENYPYAKKLVRFGRPDLESTIVGVMKDDLKDGLGAQAVVGVKTLVTFCGSRVVAEKVSDSVLVANGLADSLGLSMHHMTFHAEFYGTVGGGENRAQQTTKPVPLIASV